MKPGQRVTVAIPYGWAVPCPVCRVPPLGLYSDEERLAWHLFQCHGVNAKTSREEAEAQP